MNQWSLFMAFVACTPEAKTATLEDASYERELVACREASKGKVDACPSYVACRSQVAAKYGRKFSGVCTDGDK
jgi:hypothetical protein